MATDVTVLGAGNTGFAVAANLSLAGHSVTLAELPAFPEAIEPVRESRRIELLGVAHTGAARIADITDDVAAAAVASDTLMVIVTGLRSRALGGGAGAAPARRSDADPDCPARSVRSGSGAHPA